MRPLKITLAILSLLLLIVAAVLGFFFLMAMKWADGQIPSLYEKLNSVTANSTVMLARDGKTVLYTASTETREPITDFKEIPDNVVHATLAAEDRRFFRHSGVDYWALGRSLVKNAEERRSAQGGSTITMQLAKRLYTSTEKTMSRKVRDVALALEIEKKLTKQQILTAYLNQVYYGQGAYGVKAAAHVYFGKTDMKKLTIGEAAMLARLVRRPSEDNPYRNLKRAIANRDDVLAIELQEGWIKQDQYNKAVAEKPHLMPKHFGSGEQIWRAPYFVRYVLDVLKHDMPDIDFKTGGYTIYTTLDPDIEKVTEKAVKETVAKYRRRKITTGAFVLLDSDGEILSMVGGTDFEHHQYNVIYQGHRQPGSSFKPIVYATALTRGALHTGDYISSGPFVKTDEYTGKVWAPQNDNGFGGMVSIREAIAGSINTAAVRVCEAVGPENVVATAHDVFGYKSELTPVLSLALGSSAVTPLEHAEAYSIFQLHGDRATPFGITRVVGPDDKVVKIYGPDIQKNMLDPAVATTIDQDYLRAVVTGGTATRASVIPDARGKTGTTQEFRDAWFCGYTNNLLGIGWVANEIHDPNHNPPWYYDPMLRVFGGQVPTEMWVEVMKAAQKKYGRGSPQPPKFLGRNGIDVETSGEKPIRIKDRRDNNTDNLDNGDNTDMGDTQATPPDQPKHSKDKNTDQQDLGTPMPTDQVPETPPADVPAPKPTRRQRRERQPSPVTQTVTVEICAESGQLATAYCPETVVRTYVKGQEPRRYCTIHRP